MYRTICGLTIWMETVYHILLYKLSSLIQIRFFYREHHEEA